MTLEEKFPNAHPDFYKLYRKISKAAEGVNLFHVIAAAHEIMTRGLMYVAEDYPEWRQGFAEQLRMTADWCEFMPADAMCTAMTDDDYQALINKQRFAATQ